MNIINSNVASQVVKQTQSEVGTLHFFNHIAVVEFNEGTHVDLSSAKKTINDVFEYFGNEKPFGFVANRVNSYSISLMDVPEVKSIFPNLVAYGVVSHNQAGRMNAEIENNFCSTYDIVFDNLYEGLNTIHNRVLEQINLLSLN
ncbi:hypothetical protein [Psychroserpens luteolus]|uniref:hypothetical protein n=1 Tax=Psychroserpens luteolus TaxID=2855840 RepID=UPI001E3F6028|nr:hypothetical protein [Psychroserpens luteolus]MCD2259087.1 hypothetical protein [Psychroserpens luteolus]